MISNKIFIDFIKTIIKEDRKNVLHLFYYSIIEAVLVLSVPLAAAIVINSVLSQASLSLVILGIILLILFIFITTLQLLKEYINEKFQQKVFLTRGIDVAQKALNLNHGESADKDKHRKLMNYFFDITSIQKFFPLLLIDGLGVVIKITVSLLLLLIFDPVLFVAGVLLFTLYIVILFALGRNGGVTALARSDAKHNTIYFLQHINEEKGTREETLSKYNTSLGKYVKARQNLFRIIIRQLGFTFFAEGFIFTMFLLVGGYLVIKGTLPLGEFVAAEIIVTSITYALKGFAKQIDYIYDMVEGLYKVNKLSVELKDKQDG